MREYLNKTCDCCGEKFTEDDDIVVCPDCGTPIHRKCWNGRCPNEEKHAEGFDWDEQQKNTQADNTPPDGTEGRIKRGICGVCGQPFSENDDIVYCADCGTPMHRECRERLGRCPNESRHIDGYSWSDEHSFGEGASARASIALESFEDFVKEIQHQEEQSGEERTCFGVKHMELLHFLGTQNFSTPRFFSLFFSMAETGRKVSFNFFAGLLMPFYQFYRKMIGPSVVLALAYIILGIPQMVITLVISLHGNETLIPSELYGILDVFFYILLVLRIIVVLFNDYFYMKWSVSKILALREQYRGRPETEYMEALERAGRPKFAFVLIGVTSVYVLSYVLLGILSSMGYFA